ncbi:MAG TPA: hypothetical protein VH143_08080 [Kofleriaceae bacterium]|nr:hypothetical protein [Kofleriaceae bacterium]
MEAVYVVRHRHLVEHVAIRQLAREMGVSRNTIKRYLRGAPAGVGKPRGIAGAPVLDAVRPRVEALLEDSKHWLLADAAVVPGVFAVLELDHVAHSRRSWTAGSVVSSASTC